MYLDKYLKYKKKYPQLKRNENIYIYMDTSSNMNEDIYKSSLT